MYLIQNTLHIFLYTENSFKVVPSILVATDSKGNNLTKYGKNVILLLKNFFISLNRNYEDVYSMLIKKMYVNNSSMNYFLLELHKWITKFN